MCHYIGIAGEDLARLSIGDPRVQELVEKLVPLVIESRSVNALCERLNQALAYERVRIPIYPNRLHSLLSEDPTRTLNESTVSLIERAVSAVSNREKDSRAHTDPAGMGELVTKALFVWRASTRSPATLHEIAERLDVSPAVVRSLLERAGELPKRSVVELRLPPTGFAEETSKPTSRMSGPDWSFQDVAVRRCLDSIGAGPSRKVGLVLPTGGGKTRVALRVALCFLARYPSAAGPVLWVTHRRNLRTQAHRELQKMMSEGVKDLPQNSAELLAKRVDFVMVSEIAARLAEPGRNPALVIVDEAHHAAAASYKPIFEASFPVRGLFLTATPNRTDELPIGIDEIAYTTTYRELAERGVILLPEFEDFPVQDFDWSESSVRDLADKIISRAAEDYKKVLVIAPRIDRVEEFYTALLQRLALEDSHALSSEDIGFVHSTGNSLRILDGDGNPVKASADEFLARFGAKPRAIIVSAQMLLEGFDDPEINTVVITYPSSSMIILMQAAGRSVRYAPGKTTAFVLQARNDSIAYHLDHRWLYQEISDYLRPQLTDMEYSNLAELKVALHTLLEQHNVSTHLREQIMTSLDQMALGERCRVLLTGLPYYAEKDVFHQEAEWSAFLETPRNMEGFREVFNSFSALGAELSDPSDFLRNTVARYGVLPDFTDGSEWRAYFDMLTGMYFAHREVYVDGSKSPEGVSRPFRVHGPTTWLKYVTFHYRPIVAPELADFLQDCHNREALIAEYQRNNAAYDLVVKVPLPLGRCEGCLLSSGQATSFLNVIDVLRAALESVGPERQFGELALRTTQLVAPAIPLALLARIERFLSEEGEAALVLSLARGNPSWRSQAIRNPVNSSQTEVEANA